MNLTKLAKKIVNIAAAAKIVWPVVKSIYESITKKGNPMETTVSKKSLNAMTADELLAQGTEQFVAGAIMTASAVKKGGLTRAKVEEVIGKRLDDLIGSEKDALIGTSETAIVQIKTPFGALIEPISDVAIDQTKGYLAGIFF
ncbi:MAG: hypothetical protein GF404_01620 [candidate division Zixibacteria bacterium]|nr:hypothetical protein [candidate division Zixibacteria bacterium]